MEAPQFKDKELLERVQRRFTRMIPELKQLACADRLDSLKDVFVQT